MGRAPGKRASGSSGSATRRWADAGWGLANVHEQLTHSNQEVFLVLQIAAVEYFDILFVWPGVPFDFNRSSMQSALDRGADHCFLVDGLRNAFEQYNKVSIRK